MNGTQRDLLHPQGTANTRRHDLDALRAFAMLLGIAMFVLGGIAAVIGVADVTTVLQTGQRIEVDGTAGRLRIAVD